MKYLLLIFALASCSQEENITPLSRIYQPKVLILLPNTEVKTKDGLYISGQNFEIWHSALTVEKLEKELSQF